MPSGLRAPFSTMPTQYSEAGNYLVFYEGGWQELFPSIGDPASVRGASLGVHGEACMLPWTWRLIEESDKCISVELRAYMLRTPFELTKRLTLRSGTRMLSICERAQNHGQVAMPLCWGHHPALGGDRCLKAKCMWTYQPGVGSLTTYLFTPIFRRRANLSGRM